MLFQDLRQQSGRRLIDQVSPCNAQDRLARLALRGVRRAARHKLPLLRKDGRRTAKTSIRLRFGVGRWRFRLLVYVIGKIFDNFFETAKPFTSVGKVTSEMPP